MPDWEFPVEAGHVLQFARALGDQNPSCAGSGSVIAPPTFTAASEHYRPDSRLRPQPGQPWRGSGRTVGQPSSSGEGSLHAEQHYDYHRPIRAGERLRVHDDGTRTWDKPSRSGAVLRFTERTTQYLDADGRPVVTERRVTVAPAAAPRRDPGGAS
jgi:N-terminal half of MaoC dehydratase